MASRQDAVNNAIEASEMQKRLVSDTRMGLFPMLTDARELVSDIRTKGIKIKITKLWPLSLEIRINN